jgi:hypothetical protein
MLVISAVSLLGGMPLWAAAGASVAAKETPAEACADQSTGPVDAAFALAVCTDLTQDLAGIGQLLGQPIIQPTSSRFTTPVRVVFDPEEGAPNVLLETTPFAPLDLNTHGLIGDEPCQVTFYPAVYQGEKPLGNGVSKRLHVLISHEAVHCYQDVVTNAFKAGLGAGPAFPPWVSEGSATYLGTLYATYGEDGTASYWKGWLGASNKNLTLRERDSVGWYSLVAHVNGDPLWSKMANAWLAYLKGGTSAYLAALGANSDAVAQAWAPSVLNSPAWGDAWTTNGIGVPPDAQPTALLGLSAGSDADREQIASLAAIVDDESVVNDALIEVSVTDGYASVHDATGYSDIGFQDQIFCLGSACKTTTAVSCPGVKAPIKPIELTPPFVVAAGGGTNPATYEIAKIDQTATPGTPLAVPASAGPCDPRPPGAAPTSAFSDGDPHLQSLNGGDFDFQGAGEYSLVRSANGDVDVQIRATPVAHSNSVSWNTAVAMRIVTSTVEVDAGTPIKVLIGGKPAALGKLSSVKLPGGGHLAYTTNGLGGDIVASWPDGSSLDVYADGLGENATFTPPPAGVDTFSGLLAAWVAPTTKKAATNPNSETLLGGNGHRYVLDPTTRTGLATLYGPFANSYRVQAKSSLFTYAKGKSTSSYVVKGFPVDFARLANLPAGTRAKAEATCKSDGVTDTNMLADCVLDVGETGQTDLATAPARTPGGGGSVTQPAPGNGSLHPVSYYFSHPCQAVTPAEIDQALGFAYPESVSVDGGCPIGTVPGDQVLFTHQTIAQFNSDSDNRGSVGSGPVSSLGHAAYCVVKPISALLQSYVLVSLGSAGSLQILADNCADATTLAADALSHISGR